MNIRELEITKEMYNRAKEVEDIFKKTQKLDCRSEEFKKLNKKFLKLEYKFEEEISDDFDTLEIVNEYERRERNKVNDKRKTEDKKMSKQEKKFIKFIGKKICLTLSGYNYRYGDDLTDYAKECFKEERYNAVQYYIDWAEDRGVNPSIIEYLNSMNNALWSGNNTFIF